MTNWYNPPMAYTPPPMLTAKTMRDAEKELARNDRVMAAIVKNNPAITMRKAQPPFHSLVVSVINQQLSQKAAATIAGRVMALTGGGVAAPETMARVKDGDLRKAGLSANKVRFVRALTEAAKGGELDAAALRKLPDEEIISRLTAIRGVGQWTAEMFMMFALRRPDVLSLGDAGLRRSARIHYGAKSAAADEKILARAAKKWRPWRTVACLHLWRALS